MGTEGGNVHGVPCFYDGRCGVYCGCRYRGSGSFVSYRIASNPSGSFGSLAGDQLDIGRCSRADVVHGGEKVLPLSGIGESAVVPGFKTSTPAGARVVGHASSVLEGG